MAAGATRPDPDIAPTGCAVLADAPPKLAFFGSDFALFCCGSAGDSAIMRHFLAVIRWLEYRHWDLRGEAAIPAVAMHVTGDVTKIDPQLLCKCVYIVR